MGHETLDVPETLDEEHKWRKVTWDGKSGYARFLRKEGSNRYAFSLELPDWDGQHFSINMPSYANDLFGLAYVVAAGGVGKHVTVSEFSRKGSVLEQLGTYTTDNAFEKVVGFGNIKHGDTLEL